MTFPRRRLLGAAALLAVFTAACGEDTTTSPSDSSSTGTSTSTTTVTITGTPDPTTASASPDSNYAWTGAFVVTVANTNSSPITIKSISADLQQSSAGIVITPITGTDESFRFDVRAPHNRVDTNANMAIPFTFYYTLPNGGREALVTLTFAVATDDGASGNVTTTVKLQ